LTILKHALEGRQYLVGEAFSRADVTTACMLMLVNPAPDDLFLFPAGMRPMYTAPRTLDAAFAPIFAWRDEMYREYRGEAVKP
jgi:glutathione S-transferase